MRGISCDDDGAKTKAEKSSSGRIMINYCNSNKLCIMYV